jgi:hypothetical protein
MINDLLKHIAGNFDFCYFMDYEMFGPNDRFGKMMVKNFRDRGIDLVGMGKYPDLVSQKKRFEE